MSVHPTGQEQDSWADHDSLTIRLAVIEQYQQPTQHLGRYVGVVHPMDGRYNAQDGGTANSDVEETVIADDDDVRAKVESVRGSISSTNSGGDTHPYSSSSNSSYVNLSSPSSVRQGGAQHAPSSGNDPTTESTGTGYRSAVPGNPALPVKKERKKRSEFERDKLEETNLTRKYKACVACRKQKIRCTVSEEGPEAPCAKCQKTKTSKSGKVIHCSVCYRTLTLTSIIAARPGGLGLTRRWEGTKMANVDVTDWADNTIRTIHMLQGLTETPIKVQVRKFKPKEGDITYRQWDYNGKPQRHDLEPYCLADIHATAAIFSNYLSHTALKGLREAAHSSGELVQETFRMVQEHAAKLKKRITDGPDKELVTKEWQLLMRVVKLVWSLRHTTGSVWLDGPDKLGMTPPEDDSYPLRNPKTREKEVSLPRLIVAQFDSIQNQSILPDQLKRVLRDLENNLSSPKHDWFTMYLAVFMLLHEISVASKDRYRWARERHQKTRYGAGKYADLGMYMENFQKASFSLLAYWHYYKCYILDDADWDASGATTKLKALEPEYVRFMERSAQLMREAEEANKIPKPPLDGCWEHELFFVSRMFKRDWMEGYQTFNFMDKDKDEAKDEDQDG
ncbi:hypothetical protein CONLIGDRAFT_680282 [Coniochaeta ligniaria NRRL 30616]|uniref:Zn(2)-C6 fungal-type domain-containing protein n=1 Tax=Coniochaeta ligniaria NRRL 30616 TaxID=1408157 RepID=A0A1J7J810_9PEZI|nr:hypothetical protein CONLIGDRAFT_680282 [Coniochaeta ligniaria NRRL 30616]